MELGRPGEAEAPLREQVDIESSVLGECPNGPRERFVALLRGRLGTLLERLGRPGEAEPLLREALGSYRSFTDFEREMSAGMAAPVLVSLGRLLAARGRPGEAGPLLREALSMYASLAAHEGAGDEGRTPAERAGWRSAIRRGEREAREALARLGGEA